ncbi:MAG: hypothetical protein ACFFDQ_13910 [Candidatus Thorarchaeota archaeon]
MNREKRSNKKVFTRKDILVETLVIGFFPIAHLLCIYVHEIAHSVVAIGFGIDAVFEVYYSGVVPQGMAYLTPFPTTSILINHIVWYSGGFAAGTFMLLLFIRLREYLLSIPYLWITLQQYIYMFSESPSVQMSGNMDFFIALFLGFILFPIVHQPRLTDGATK